MGKVAPQGDRGAECARAFLGGASVRICIISNPVAGGGLGNRRARALCAALEGLGHTVDVRVTQAAGDAERYAAESVPMGYDCFVATGGDGTANEMVNGLGDSGIPFTVLAVGTANVVARQFKIPRQPEKLAAMINRHQLETMDLGVAQGRRFLLGAGAGLDAAITTKVKKLRGRTSSLWIWVRPAIETILTYRFPEVRVTVDGRIVSERAQYAIVGNCIYSAGVFPSTPRARTNDGLLDVCLIHDITPLKCAGMAVHVWQPSFIERRDVVYAQGKEIRFEPAGEEAAPLQIDGDPAGELPVDFSVLPAAARIIVP